MAVVSAAQVRELRTLTGAGMMDCKKALESSDGDVERAVGLLREWGLAELSKRKGREAKEGIVDSYIHAGGRIGVLLEVNCETDFVARNEEFRQFAHDVAMQVAAGSPMVAQYVSRENVPEAVVDAEKDIYRTAARNEGKPENVIEKIADGKMEKFYANVCLLEQPFIRDSDRKLGDLLAELVGKIGENISVRRFVRYELGETLG